MRRWRALADVAVVALTGAEPIAGSTRMRAGTAQKIVLNTISTAAMIELGKTYRNRMVDVVASNAKLRARAERLLRELAGDVDAAALLAAAGEQRQDGRRHGAASASAGPKRRRCSTGPAGAWPTSSGRIVNASALGR